MLVRVGSGPTLPVLLGAVGLLASLGLWRSQRYSERQAADSAFRLQAAQQVALVQRECQVALGSLHWVARLFDSSEIVKPDEFENFTVKALGRDDALRALLWIERPEGTSSEVVTFSRGPESGSFAPGTRLEVGSLLYGTLQRATNPAEEALSGPLILPDVAGPRVLAALAVHHAVSDLPLGHVALLLDVQRLVPSMPADLALRIEDTTSTPVPLARAGDTDEVAGLTYTPPIEMLGGRSWLTTCSATPAFVGAHTTWWPLAVLGLSLAVSAALVTLLVLSTSKKHVQSLVERRTSEVVESYATLASEADERRLAEREARDSQQQLRDILDLLPSQVYVKDRYGRMRTANQATADAYGSSVDDLIRPSSVDINETVRDPSPELAEDRRLMAEHRSVILNAVPFVDALGRRRILRVTKIPCRVSGQAALLHVCTDVTEQKQAEIVASKQNLLLGELARGLPPQDVLLHVIETAEEIASGLRCTVLFLSPDGHHLVRGLAPSMPEEYSEAIDGLLIGPGAGSCGAAAHSGQRVIVEDVFEHPNWAPYRDLARRAEIRACWSEPIRASDGEILGTFAMYYSEPRRPEPYEERFIESMAHLAGIAIERGHLTGA
jgi:PAS domain S-box-containing protein